LNFIFFLKKIIIIEGVNVARYVGEHLHKRVISDPEFEKGNYGKALKNGFLGIDEDLQGGKYRSLFGLIDRIFFFFPTTGHQFEFIY